MSEITHEAVFQPEARALFFSLQPAAREALWRLIRIIEIDPHIDGRFKVAIDLDGIIETVYVDEFFWLYYHIADNHFVVIETISVAWPEDWTQPAAGV